MDGGPLVLMECSTPCLVCRVEKLGLVISGKLARSLSYSFPGWEMVLRCSAGAPASQSGEEKYVSASTSRLPFRSTRSELARRKSAPNKGRDTSAMMNSHLYCFIAKHNVMVRFPNVRIVLPFAATKEAPGCVFRMAILVAGKTLTSAPVSTKNRLPEILSRTKSRPSVWLDAMAPTDAQPVRFPAIHMAAGICEPLLQTCGGNSKGRV